MRDVEQLIAEAGACQREFEAAQEAVREAAVRLSVAWDAAWDAAVTQGMGMEHYARLVSAAAEASNA